MSTLLPRIIMKNESIGLVRSEQFVNHIQTFFFMIVGKCIFKRSLHFAIGNKHSISSKQDLIYREVGLSIALGNQRNRLRGLFPDLFVETNSGEESWINESAKIDKVHENTCRNFTCFHFVNPSHHFATMMSNLGFPPKLDLWRVLERIQIVQILRSQGLSELELELALPLFSRSSWQK
jgi:hypothetical protein